MEKITKDTYPPYIRSPERLLKIDGAAIGSFIDESKKKSSIEDLTIDSFGAEWEKFNTFSQEELERIGREYFDIVTHAELNEKSIVLDMGCGSGRWSRYLSNKVRLIEAIDPSKAVFLTAKNNADLKNVRWSHAGVEEIPFKDDTFDFILCLGVLHHVPDTSESLKKVVNKLKPNGHILLYLYYSLDNRGRTYKILFRLSNLIRIIVSSSPKKLKGLLADTIAFIVYLPLVTAVRLTKFFRLNFYKKLPLSYYENKSFYIMRNDALDRFGTPLEQRFSKKQIEIMMFDAGLTDLNFSPNAPYWHVTGKKI